MEVEAFMHRSAKALLYVGLYINSSWFGVILLEASLCFLHFHYQ